MKKRILALVLSMIMIFSPTVSAYAETDGITEESIVTACQECGSEDGHTEECSLYIPETVVCEVCQQETCICNQPEIVDENETTKPQVGDKIWIKPGSKVYVNYAKGDIWGNTHTVWFAYELTIEEILTDENNNVWYKFDSSNTPLSMWKYVKIENTSSEEPETTEPTEEENACNCGENAPANIADHADSCPRKQYIKTLFEDKTAEEIYTEWENYDETIQNDLLNMLQKWDSAKYKELNSLLHCICGSEDGIHSEECPLYAPPISDTVIIEDGKTINVSGLPEGSSLQIEEADENILNEVKEEAENHFARVNTYRTPNIIKETLFSYDISVMDAGGSKWQPENSSVEVTLTVPGLKVGAFENVYVGHKHGETVSILETCVDYQNETITFTTQGFSVFYGFIVDFEYNGYKYSMNGGTEAKLSDVMDTLGIDRSVSSVERVEFTDASLIEIKQEDEDWTLKSLKAFGTTEWLKIYFKDGTLIEIRVTDPVLYYYLTDTSWCMDTFKSKITANNNDYTAPSGEVMINATAITGSSLGGTHENREDGTVVYDVQIYARPGMAIRFDRYSTFNGVNLGANCSWVWGKDQGKDSDSTGYNYVVVKNDITTVTTVTFNVKIGNHGDGNTEYVPCEIRLVIVPEGSGPTLLKDALKAEDTPDEIKNTYSIKEIPVTLYNYDGNKYKAKYSNGGAFFSFKGVSKGQKVTVDSGNLDSTGHANGAGPIMGILQQQLDANGLPVMSEGQNIDLFSDATFDGKEVRKVQFEFIYDTEGYYTYSSNINHAQLSKDETKIQLYREAMGTTPLYAMAANSSSDGGVTDSDKNHAAGGFYPYSDINRAVNNAGNVLDWNTWKQRLESGYVKDPAPFAVDLVKSSTQAEPYSTVDMHNGLQLAADFYLPADKKSSKGKDIVYQFTGDDDLWVFIDNTLVLDIGGGHTPVSGSINFTTGEVLVEGAYYTVGDSNKKENYKKTVNFEGDQFHSLKVFYLERYAGVSNCRMRFNMPLVPSDAVIVSKNVVNQDGQDLSVTPDVAYTFTMYTAADEDDNADAKDFKPYANKAYTVIGSGASGGTLYTDSKGKFTLKDGWSAQFQGIERFTNVYVIESAPKDGYMYTGSTVSVNKAEPKVYTFENPTEIKVMQLNSSMNFDFTNKIKTQPLTIEKYVNGGADALINPDQIFTFNLDFTKPIVETGARAIKATKSSADDTLLTDGGSFELKQGEKITIPRVPVNMTYKLSENNPDAEHNSFDSPVFKLETGDGVKISDTLSFVEDKINNTNKTNDFSKNITDNGENKITVENLQRFNLKITKRILGEISTDQSFRFTVKGKNEHNEATDLEVVIPASAFREDSGTSEKDASASAVIPNVPVGAYTVSEDTAWSWRYLLDGSSQKEVTVGPTRIKLPEHVVEFKNNRSNIYWLDGNSWCQNRFGAALTKTQKTDNPNQITESN